MATPTNRGLLGRAGVIEPTQLPNAGIAAVASPLDMQFRFAADLNKALQIDPDDVLVRAKQMAQVSVKASPGRGGPARRLAGAGEHDSTDGCGRISNKYERRSRRRSDPRLSIRESAHHLRRGKDKVAFWRLLTRSA